MFDGSAPSVVASLVTAAPQGERPPPWLRRNLPDPLAKDPFMANFLAIFEHVGLSVQKSVDSIEHHLDLDLTPPAMLRYLGAWLGLALDPSTGEDRHRDLVRAMGPLLGWRGTRRGLEGVLEAMTGSRVRVGDRGGVFTRADQVPPADHTVTVEIDHLGELTERDILAFVAAEVPAGTQVEIVVGRRGTSLQRVLARPEEARPNGRHGPG